MNKENAIDFACSYLWRAYYQETFYGEHLPPLEPQHIVQSISEPQLVGKMRVYLRVDRKALELDSQIAVLRGQLQTVSKEVQKLSKEHKQFPDKLTIK